MSDRRVPCSVAFCRRDARSPQMTPKCRRQHELIPGHKELRKNSAEMLKSEKFAAAVRSAIMMHGNFYNSAAAALELLHHLDADHTAVERKRQVSKQRTAEETEITIHIADTELKQKPHKTLIYAAHDHAMQGIRAADLVSVHKVGVFAELLHQSGQFFHVILAVPIRIENKVFGAIGKAADQSGAISTIYAVLYDLKEGILGCQSAQHFPGTICGSIIDNNNLVVLRKPWKNGRGRADYFRDRICVVICGKECGYGIFPAVHL